MPATADDSPTLEQEREVIARLQRGDRPAAAELYLWYGDKLYRAVILPRLPNPELAEDVLKDTFRLAMERIHQFRLEDRSIWFWLRRIASNRAIDIHRARQRAHKFHEKHDHQEVADRTMGRPPPRPDRAPEIAETKSMVELSLSRMNSRYAMALQLRLIEDRDREECAALMDVKVGTFDVLLHRACKAFKKVYPP